MAYPLEANPLHHYYTTRNRPILGIVLHVTAGAEDTNMVGTDGSAAATIRYGQTVTRAASWHGIVDTDSVIDCLPDYYTAFHVQGYNSPTLGLEICNLTATWRDKPAAFVEATLRNAAAWCRVRMNRYGLPVNLATMAEVDAAIAVGQEFGFTYHYILDPARRRDPGVDFPWRRFTELLGEPSIPGRATPDYPEDDDMSVADVTTGLLQSIDPVGTPDFARHLAALVRAEVKQGILESLNPAGTPDARGYLVDLVREELRQIPPSVGGGGSMYIGPTADEVADKVLARIRGVWAAPA